MLPLLDDYYCDPVFFEGALAAPDYDNHGETDFPFSFKNSRHIREYIAAKNNFYLQTIDIESLHILEKQRELYESLHNKVKQIAIDCTIWIAGQLIERQYLKEIFLGMIFCGISADKLRFNAQLLDIFDIFEGDHDIVEKAFRNNSYWLFEDTINGIPFFDYICHDQQINESYRKRIWGFIRKDRFEDTTILKELNSFILSIIEQQFPIFWNIIKQEVIIPQYKNNEG